jgi:predicted amidohydrolase YtcJ
LQSCIPKADLALINGQIITLGQADSVVQALAVKGDTILAVGTAKNIRQLIGPNTKVIDLQGKTAIPGFIDGHAHFLGLGYSKMRLELSRADSWEAIVDSVARSVQKSVPGQWIVGRGWHQEKWTRRPSDAFEGFPVHERLSAVSPDNPVFLTHGTGHAIIANQKAMEMAGITSATPDPEGARIVRKPDGSLTGVFLEAADYLILNSYEQSRRSMTKEELRAELTRAIELAGEECLKNGITSFHDAGSSFGEVDLFKSLADQRKLPLRLWIMLQESNSSLKTAIQNYKLIGYGQNFLTVRAIKRFMDGALGSRSAWLLEPYNDLPSSIGINTIDPSDLRETAHIALENGFQLCTHAIGDRANRETLNIYEENFRENPEAKDLRWRIEHAQHLDPADIPRFGRLGVIASMQGCHATSDGPFVPIRLGEKRAEQGAYAWRKLLESGAMIANGTDAPVEAVDPIANYYALVTRRMANGQKFFPDQCLSRMEALRAYTVNCAWAAHEEHIKGTLQAGKLADITVLSQNILEAPDEEIKQTKVIYTIIGGKVVYSQE